MALSPNSHNNITISLQFKLVLCLCCKMFITIKYSVSTIWIEQTSTEEICIMYNV